MKFTVLFGLQLLKKKHIEFNLGTSTILPMDELSSKTVKDCALWYRLWWLKKTIVNWAELDVGTLFNFFLLQWKLSVMRKRTACFTEK